MSLLPHTHYVMTCDGCGTKRGGRAEHDNRTECEVAAYVDGWRFPAQVKLDGSKSSRVSHVCPDCLPGWKGQPALDTWKNRRGNRSESGQE